jgi:MFS family permease
VSQSTAGFAAAVVTLSLGQIGMAVQFGATFADLAPSDLRGRYMGVASSTWSLGVTLGPIAGTALLEHTGRIWLGATALATGLLLFLAQHAVAGFLRERQTGRS